MWRVELKPVKEFADLNLVSLYHKEPYIKDSFLQVPSDFILFLQENML